MVRLDYMKTNYDVSEMLTLLTQIHFCFFYITIAPVIVFCRSGRRAAKAKEVLEQKGYKKVLNAGGLKDLSYLA